MPANDIARSHANTNANALRIGPHDDIADCCEFDNELPDDWETVVPVEVSDLLQACIIAETAEQRVKAASLVLKHTKDESGIAWLVLGREGAESAKEAEGFLEKAVNLLKKGKEAEDESAEFGGEGDAYALAVADLAQCRWNSGKQKEAD